MWVVNQYMYIKMDPETCVSLYTRFSPQQLPDVTGGNPWASVDNKRV